MMQDKLSDIQGSNKLTKTQKGNRGMNLLTKTLLSSSTIAILISATTLNADTVTIPNTFSAGNTAVAAEVNDNFTAVKSAVDANDVLIRANASDIATNVTDIATNTSAIAINTSGVASNTSDIALNISDIASNDADINSLQNVVAILQGGPSGSVSVSGNAFRSDGDISGCRWASPMGGHQSWLDAGDYDDCNMVASIQIPDGAQVTSLSCVVSDAASKAQIVATLYQHSTLSFGTQPIFSAFTDLADFSGNQTISSSTVLNFIADFINNAQNSYSIGIDFVTDGTVGAVSNRTDLILYTCSVAY